MEKRGERGREDAATRKEPRSRRINLGSTACLGRRRRCIAGEHALITGGGQGIGAAIAGRLVERGARVSLLDVDAHALASRVRTLEARADGSSAGASGWSSAEVAAGVDRVHYRVCDIRDPHALENAVGELVAEAGPVDIVVNNAGVLVPGDFLEQPMEAWKRMLDVNVEALMRVTHLTLPGMYERNHGTVVNISSAAGTLGVAGLSVYAASKWAVWGFTESIRHEVWNAGKRGIHVASVHPSFLRTGLFEGARLPGLGGVIVPLVKDHNVIAEAVVEGAIRRGKTLIMRPRSVRLAVFLRGLLRDRSFNRMTRGLGANKAMRSWRGRGDGTARGEQSEPYDRPGRG